jgi:single-stranded DNA-specific DHH superfamily exonuclease
MFDKHTVAQTSTLTPTTSFSDKINQLIDLVVVSIASDLVPITGENRILAYFGLKKLNTNPCLGLKVFIDNLTVSVLTPKQQ